MVRLSIKDKRLTQNKLALPHSVSATMLRRNRQNPEEPR